jgi:WD40 repeat protein
LQQQKKALHLVSVKSMVAEITYELADCKELSAQRGIDVSKLCDSIVDVCKQLVQEHEQRDVGDYSNDDIFQQLIREVFDTKTWQRARLKQVSCNFEQVARGAPLLGHDPRIENDNLLRATYRIYRVAFHPTAPILATASIDSTVKLWRINSETRTAVCLSTLRNKHRFGTDEEQRYDVESIAFHPTAPILATGSCDCATLWRFNSDCSEVTCVATLKGHSRPVLSVAFHPTEPILATGSADETAKLWRLNSDNSATSVATLEEHKGKWYSRSVSSVAFHPTAPILATGSYDKTVKLWRINSDNSAAACVATLRGHASDVLIVAFHPTAPILATGSRDGTFKLWRINSDNSAAIVALTVDAHSRGVYSVAFHPIKPILATGGFSDSEAKLWRVNSDFSNTTCLQTMKHKDPHPVPGMEAYAYQPAVDVAFHPTAPILATGSLDPTLFTSIH